MTIDYPLNKKNNNSFNNVSGANKSLNPCVSPSLLFRMQILQNSFL